MKLFDFVWLAMGILLTSVTAWAVASPASTQPRLEVQTDAGVWVYPLTATRTIEAPGPLGVTDVQVRAMTGKPTQVWVSDSPCKNKICIEMGKISQVGQWVACLPNHVFVRISGTPTAGGLDATAY